jgi:hypothetical protein
MKRKHRTGLLALFMTAFMVMGTVAYADTNQPLSVTVVCKSTDKTITLGNMKWNLYHVAQGNEANGYTCLSLYQDAKVSFDDSSTSALAKAAETLAAYVDKNNLAADAKATGSDTGIVSFTQFGNGNALENGEYLLVGEAVTVGDVKYTPAPVIVELESWSDTNAQLTVYAKFTEETITPEEETTTSEVTTTPETTTEPETTTGSGTDGENPGNGDSEQPTTEPGADETTIGDEEEESTVSEEETTTVSDGDKKTSVKTGEEETTTASTDTETTVTSSNKLPQTGQLQWPIPAMALSGIVLVGAGVTCFKKDGADEA